MINSLRDFNTKVRKKYIFNTIIGNECLGEISNESGGKSTNICHIKKSNYQD